MHPDKRQKTIELVALCRRLFHELAVIQIRFSTDRFLQASNPSVYKQKHLVLIERLNISTLAMTLFKITEVNKKYSAFIPEQYKDEFKNIDQELDNRGIKNFRHQYCGHILNKKTNKPISDADIETAIQLIRKEPSYEDFEDWFWESGRLNGEKSIAACLAKIANSLQKNESITLQELEQIF